MNLSAARNLFDDLPNQSVAELRRELVLVNRQLAGERATVKALERNLDQLRDAIRRVLSLLEYDPPLTYSAQIALDTILEGTEEVDANDDHH